MKSSPNIHSKSKVEKFQNWNPPELEINVTAPPLGAHQEQFLAIFQKNKQDSDKQPDARPVVYAAETSQRYSAWQPAEMASIAPAVRKTEWIFFGLTETPPKIIQQPQRFEFKALDEPTLEEQQEEEALMILEHARLQADEIILAAQAEADNLLQQAQEEIEEHKRIAYQQGHDQGLCELEDALKATRSLVEEVQTWKAELMSQGERILIDMLVEIAKKMFGEGVQLSPEALQINLNRIMENAQGLGNLNIFLNPQDVKALDPSWTEYQILVSGEKVRIIPSSKITRGGCFVKGIMGSVDGRVETQLEAVLDTIEETGRETE